MNWDLIPHSRAENSWDLLEDVIKAIEEEPRRILMNDWRVDQEDMESYSIGQSTKDRITRFPACGTVGCISGWLGILAAKDEKDVNPFGGTNIRCLLPGRMNYEFYRDAEGLFYGDPGSLYPFPDLDIPHGSPEYVAHVVANIRKFMWTWETELKEFRLPSVGV